MTEWPTLRLALFDGVFRAKSCKAWCKLHCMRFGVAHEESDQKGFVVLKQRWVVERTLSWFSHWGGLLSEQAGRLDAATGRLTFVARLIALSALANPDQ